MDVGKNNFEVRNSITLTSSSLEPREIALSVAHYVICAIFIMVRAYSGVVGRRYRASAVPVAAGIGRAIAPYVQRLAQLGINRATSSWRGRKRGRSTNSMPKYPKGKVPQRRQYSTRGTIGPVFRKPRRFKKVAPYQVRGYSLHIESGGTRDNDEIVYLGHGVAAYQLTAVVWGAVFRKLFAKAGISIISDDTKVFDPSATGRAFTIQIFWSSGPGQVQQYDELPYTTDTTFGKVVADMNIKLWGAGTLEHYYPNTLKIMNREISGSNFIQVCTMDLTNAMIDMACVSSMAVQNRTLATNAGLGIDQNRNDVLNNPLTGKIYSGTGNGCGFRVDQETAFTIPLVANNTSGVMVTDIMGNPTVAGASGSAGQIAVYRRPPLGSAFKYVTKSVSVVLNPGIIRSSKFFWKKSMQFHKFLDGILHTATNSIATDAYRNNFGKFEFWGLEKRCNTRSDEPTISLGFELDQKYTATLRLLPQRFIAKSSIIN